MVVGREVDTREVERLRGQQQVLSHALRVFAEATAAPHTLLDTVARETAEAMHAFCIFATTTDGGHWVDPVAMFDGAGGAVIDVFARLAHNRLPLDGAHPLARSIETGEPTLMPTITAEQVRARFDKREDQEAAI